jgi:hypothetical protein
MDPAQRLKVNMVSEQFWGGSTTLKADVQASGAENLQFAVTSKR